MDYSQIWNLNTHLITRLHSGWPHEPVATKVSSIAYAVDALDRLGKSYGHLSLKLGAKFDC